MNNQSKKEKCCPKCAFECECDKCWRGTPDIKCSKFGDCSCHSKKEEKCCAECYGKNHSTSSETFNEFHLPTCPCHSKKEDKCNCSRPWFPEMKHHKESGAVCHFEKTDNPCNFCHNPQEKEKKICPVQPDRKPCEEDIYGHCYYCGVNMLSTPVPPTDNSWKSRFDAKFPSSRHTSDIYPRKELKDFLQKEIQAARLSERLSERERIRELLRCKSHSDQLCGGCKECGIYQSLTHKQ